MSEAADLSREIPVVNTVGARLTPTGRVLEFDAGSFTLRAGDRVVVEQGRNQEVASVVIPSGLRRPRGPLGTVVRLAEEHDLRRAEERQTRVQRALLFARERARVYELPIKVFRVEMPPGGGKATFYFSSENRVDFRAMVRDLATEFHCRVEMRQVGVRDEAKIVGGIGSCGLELCCTTFLPKFAPVSIKMAKNQNLNLIPSKVSGQCGRLKCCLVYEDAHYVEAAKLLPKVGKRVETPKGVGKVGDLDVLAGRVRVYFEDQPPRVFSAEEVQLVAAPTLVSPPPPMDQPEPEKKPERERRRERAGRRDRKAPGAGTTPPPEHAPGEQREGPPSAPQPALAAPETTGDEAAGPRAGSVEAQPSGPSANGAPPAGGTGGGPTRHDDG